jgi:hypothetical protein
MHFFGCRECGQNFALETEKYIEAVKKPYDEVLYLWTGNLIKKTKKITSLFSINSSQPCK